MLLFNIYFGLFQKGKYGIFIWFWMRCYFAAGVLVVMFFLLCHSQFAPQGLGDLADGNEPRVPVF